MADASPAPAKKPMGEFQRLFWEKWPDLRIKLLFALKRDQAEVDAMQAILERVLVDLDSGFKDPAVLLRTMHQLARMKGPPKP